MKSTTSRFRLVTSTNQMYIDLYDQDFDKKKENLLLEF